MPLPITTQKNGMPTYQGLAPGLNTAQQISNMAWTPYFISLLTSTRTLVAAESGAVVWNPSITQACTLTLPAISTGPFYFKIIQAAGYGITVTAATADTMITFNDLTADSVVFSTSSEIIAGSYEVWCDGTSLVVLPSLASEAQTVTVAT